MIFDAAKALKFRVVMLSGEEEALRRKALDGILSAAEIAKDDFDLDTVAADASSPAEWVASVGTAPFLASRRVTIVRHLLRCDHDRLKGTSLANLPESALLILVADEETGSDDRLQRMKTTVRTGWVKAVQGAKGFVADLKPDEREVKAEVKAKCAELGCTLTDRAQELLLEMTSGNLSRALDELEKLALFSEGRTQIGESEVRAVVVPSREWNVFKMIDATVANQMSEALRQLRVLISGTSKAEEAAYRSILPMMSRQLRLLWQARLCIEAQCSPSNAPGEILALFPDKPNLAKEPPYRQSACTNIARRLSFPQLSRSFEIVSDADARLKGALTGFSGIETLERMLLELAQALRA